MHARRAIADILNFNVARNGGATLAGASEPSALTYALLPLSAPLLRVLRPEWQALEQSASLAHPFMDADFIAASLGLFDRAGEPRILEVRKGDALIGVLIVHVAERFARLPISFACQTLHLHQFVGAPLVRAGAEHDFWRTVFGWLDDAPTHLRGLRLRRLPTNSALSTALAEAASEQGRFVRALDGFDRAFERRSRSSRKVSTQRKAALTRQRENLEREGRVEVETLNDAANLAAWTEDFIDLEHCSWKGAWGTSIHQREGEAAFYRDLLARMFAEDRLRFMRLSLDGRMIAASVDIAAGNELFAIKRAFDPAYRKHSPGVLLEHAALDAFRLDGRYQAIDSCENRSHAVLDRYWNDRRRYSDYMIARDRRADVAAIKAAFGLIDAKAASECIVKTVLAATRNS